MNDKRFKELARKCYNGEASDEETTEFMAAYRELEGRYAGWDERTMGNELEFKGQMLADFNARLRNHGRFIALRRLSKIAAIVLLVMAPALLIWQYRYAIQNVVDPIKRTTLVTRGEIKLIRLGDGTRVWLNSGTRISFPQQFRSHTARQITLSGEAYFEVAHIADQPFIVHAGKLNTTVLGTSFNVKAYDNDAGTEVSVLTGKVGVTPVGSKRNQAALPVVFLTPDKRVVYNKRSAKFTPMDVTNTMYKIAWRTGRLSFNNERLAEVVHQVERRYQVHIGYDNRMAACPVFADFDHESLDNVLKILTVSFRGKLISNNQGYYIMGKPCE